MKTHAAVAIVVAVLALHPIVWAQAQQCYTPIPSFHSNYTLTASGTGSCPSGDTCSVNQSASATVSITPAVVGCPLAEWQVTYSNFTASINDSIAIPCLTQTYSGTTTLVSGDSLMIDLANPSGATYIAAPNPAVQATYTETPCDGQPSTVNVDVNLSPSGSSNWPPSFPLPAAVEPLNNSGVSLQGEIVLGFDAPYSLSFGDGPTYNPDDCKAPGNSTIGCQTQSLEEDLPIVGTGMSLHYESNRAPGAGEDSAASADAAMIGGWTLSAHHAYDANTNTFFFGDGNQRNGDELGTPVSYNGNLLLTSEDGSEVYVFTTAGQHLQTLRPLTGALEYQFGYDSAGNLVTVTDASGNVTSIQRNATEQPTAIVSPYGQTTTLSVDGNGFLSQVTDPLGKSTTLVNTSTGLLTSRTDPNGNTFTYTYDSFGRLTQDADPLGGYTALARTDATSGFGWTNVQTTAMGRTSSYQTTLTLPWVQDGTQPQSEQHTNTWPDGLQATSSKSLASGQLSESVTLPDGTTDSETLGPDPVWGLQVPVDRSETLTQGNLTMNITGSRSTSLGTAGDPFTVSTETNTQTINGRTYTSTFTGSSLTWVNTSPVGRTITVGLDSLERVASTQIERLTATNFAYDSRGRLASTTQGPRRTSFGYNSDGFLASLTNPLKLKTSFAYDADGNVLTATLPDGREIDYTYDANRNLTSVTPPGKSAHNFAYNSVNMLETYTPPTVLGTTVTTYAYDLDRDLTTITRPDGETITYSYDDAGRLISITIPTGTTKYTYSATTGNLASVAKSAEKIAYSYNGPLPTKSTWTGTVASDVSRTYNDNFWVSSESIGGGSKVTLDYDNDGLLTKAGSLAIKRSAKNGLITGTTLGVATDSRTYNSFGELTGYTASANGAVV